MTGRILENRVAIVTGARRGIGRAIALAFAAAGADVAICDVEIGDGLLAATKSEIEKLGSKAIDMRVNISCRQEVEEFVNRVEETYDRIDVLANCAGVWIPGETLVDCSEKHWDTVIDTNLKGTYLCCQAAARRMIRRRQGSIINLSSEVGLTPGAGAGAYPISKAGIIMLTRQIALELAPHRIRVNAIAPGIVKTDFNAEFWKDPQMETRTSDMVPLGRLAEPGDVAESALFLASGQSSYITGEVISVNGGWHPSSSL